MKNILPYGQKTFCTPIIDPEHEGRNGISWKLEQTAKGSEGRTALGEIPDNRIMLF